MRKFKINIITPCTRPDNLKLMYNNMLYLETSDLFHWFIIFDTNRIDTLSIDILNEIKEFKNTTFSFCRNSLDPIYKSDRFKEGLTGTGKSADVLRKYGIDIIKSRNHDEEQFIWFLDDDNCMQKGFYWKVYNILKFTNKKAILFRLFDELTFDNVEDVRLDPVQLVFHMGYSDVCDWSSDTPSTFIKDIYSNYKNEFILDNSYAVRKNALKWPLVESERFILYKDLDNICDESNNHYFSTVTTCRGREKNLIEILPSWCEHSNIKEVIVVDWTNDPPLIEVPEFKQLFDKYTKIKIIRIDDQKYFNNGKSQNLGINFISQDMFIKIDGDCKLLNSDLITKLSKLKSGIFTTGYTDQDGLTGFIVVNSDTIKSVGAHREDFDSYGWEDEDLYFRLRKLGLTRYNIFDLNEHIYHIPHKSRSEFHKEKDIKKANRNNQIYSFNVIQPVAAKYDVIFRGHDNRYLIVKEIDPQKTINSFLARDIQNPSDNLDDILNTIVVKLENKYVIYDDNNYSDFDFYEKLSNSKIIRIGNLQEITDLIQKLEKENSDISNLYTIALLQKNDKLNELSEKIDLIISNVNGIKEEYPSLYNPLGNLLFISNSERGNRIILSLDTVFHTRIEFSKIQKYNQIF